MTSSSAEEFLRVTRRYLCEEFPAKLRLTLESLPEEDLWWRPNATSNSVGNLVLHLAGNVRQWIVAGVGGAPDLRERSAEFAADGGMSKEQVTTRLDSVLAEVARTLESLPSEALDESREIQGMDVGVLEAIYHVTEHFSMHLGQIMWITKARSGGDLGLYEVDEDGSVIGTRW